MKRTPVLRLVVAFLIICPTMAQNNRYEEQAFAFAKRILVSKLDPRLPQQPFGQWFQEIVGPDAKIECEANDCGEQTGDTNQKGRDIPTCVEAEAELSDGRRVIVRIAIGTLRKGISGIPVVNYSVVLDKAVIRDVRKLSELPIVLREKAN